MIIITTIMSMGSEYVFELRPPTGLFFISRKIYKHGEARWSDVDREKLLTRPPELSGNPIIKQEECAKGMRI
jgi:hypothetical protein